MNLSPIRRAVCDGETLYVEVDEQWAVIPAELQEMWLRDLASRWESRGVTRVLLVDRSQLRPGEDPEP